MYIFFEQYAYDATNKDVQKGLRSLVPEWQNIDKKVSVNYVGYFFEPALGDCVFCLPKVLLKDQKEGDKVRTYLMVDECVGIEPEKVITPDGQAVSLKGHEEFRKFLYNFAIWIYRTLAVYREDNKDSKAIYWQVLPQVGSGSRQKVNTYLDVILSLIRFNRENQNFFMFTVRNIHSGVNKINWNRTISKSQALMQDDTPIYLNPVNKKRQINFDEELFIIFFSILDYINNEYGFRVPVCVNYPLLTNERIRSYRDSGMGVVRLRRIKYKYFSDKALQLWNLCYSFFDISHTLYSNVSGREFLLARNYFVVFEAMIDKLVGTPHNIIPSGLQDQDDGKVVDHLYVDLALSTPGNEQGHDVYYIGDSKYYSIGHDLTSESVAKQYTYARNVIQWNIDYWNKSDDEKSKEGGDSSFKNVRLRNDLNENIVEGYNIIPNFFISAFVNEKHKYDDEEGNFKLHGDSGDVRINTHFPNRLFDRDTLILSHYDVNFLYVVMLYARNKEYEQSDWKEKVRKKFREQVQKVLEEKYEFFVLKPKDSYSGSCRSFIEEHFKDVLGKLYQPKEYVREGKYILALEKKEIGTEGESLLGSLNRVFDIGECKDENGNTKMDVVPEKYNYAPKQVPKDSKIDENELVLIGCVKSEKHKEWIMENGYYNIPVIGKKERRGAVMLNRNFYNIGKVLLYLYDGENEASLLGLYRIADPESIPEVISQKIMRSLPMYDGYPFDEKDMDDGYSYLMYEIETESCAEEIGIEIDNEFVRKFVAMQEIKGRAEVEKLGTLLNHNDRIGHN